MKQYKVLQWAFSFLERYNREQKVAEVLLQHLTEQTTANFYAHMQEELPAELINRFKTHIKNHATKGIPIQHMIGTAPFYGRDFYVNEDVLIPRFETEEVVFHAIEELKQWEKYEHKTIADLGTGSGVIAITLALALPSFMVYATDISARALRVASRNATKHRAQLHFFQGDFLRPLIDASINPALIIANPPYIAERERAFLTDTVKNYDPALALFAKKDGLAAYETIVHQIAELPTLKQRKLIFEIGHSQGEQVTNIIQTVFPESKVRVLQDINGKDRIVSATW